LTGFGKLRVGAALAATGAILTFAATAQAQRPPSLGAGVPWGQTGIQLYDFNNYLSNGAGEITCPAPPAPPTANCVAPPVPTTNATRLTRVLDWLESKDVHQVELYGYPGNPFPGTNPQTPLNVQGLLDLRKAGDERGIRFPGRHGNLTEANWANQITASKIIGQDHIGEAGLPGGNAAFNSYTAVLNTVQVLNRLGKASVEAGLGPAYFHNHQQEFNTRYVDDGVLKSAWEIIMDRTDPRWVYAQIDIGWAACGLAHTTAPTRSPADAMAEVTRLINKFQRRIISYHVKDIGPENRILPACGNNDQREIGQGAINFAPMFTAAANRSRYYLMERDPVGIGGPTNFNPFTNTDNSLKAMRGAPAPTLFAAPKLFASVPAGTAAAANQMPITVTNIGDAPLVFGNNAPTIAAEANDGGAATAADFAIVSQDCTGKTLAPGTPSVADDPTTPANEFAHPVPGGSCTVNVGFKPTRTNYTSVARLQFNTPADDSMERVLLSGKSTAEAVGSVGGSVDSILSLGIGAPASFGSFVPAVARNYDTASAATVTSTAGDATLSVTDTSTTAPGHLVNGTFSLPSPLTVRAANAAQPNPAYVALSETTGTPVNLVTYTGPTTTDAVTLGFRQAIGATDVLRAGTYSKTLTFTLSTTTP
jgi:sugar phosphate isomerase/epimerase